MIPPYREHAALQTCAIRVFYRSSGNRTHRVCMGAVGLHAQRIGTPGADVRRASGDRTSDVTAHGGLAAYGRRVERHVDGVWVGDLPASAPRGWNRFESSVCTLGPTASGFVAPARYRQPHYGHRLDPEDPAWTVGDVPFDIKDEIPREKGGGGPVPNQTRDIGNRAGAEGVGFPDSACGARPLMRERSELDEGEDFSWPR